MSLSKVIITKMNIIKGNTESFCHEMSLHYGNSFIVFLIKSALSLMVLISMLLPTWVGLGIFALISWVADIQHDVGLVILSSALMILLAIPQLWLGFGGLCIIILIILS